MRALRPDRIFLGRETSNLSTSAPAYGNQRGELQETRNGHLVTWTERALYVTYAATLQRTLHNSLQDYIKQPSVCACLICRGSMLASQPSRLRSAAPLRQRRKRCYCSQVFASASAASAASAVVILPGLGNASEDYDELAAALSASLGGAAVVTASVARVDWLRNAAGVVNVDYWRGTLCPTPTVDWYLERVDAAVARALEASGGAPVQLLAHSAGGWLARVWLAQPGNAARVATLLTLGSPLRPPPSGVVDQTRGILTWVDANCASAQELADSGVRVVCLAGRFVRGSDTVSDPAAFLIGQAYRQVCGESACWGDGITPVDWALLPGAEHVTLEGCYHTPLGAGPERPWYGSAALLPQWVGLLRREAEAESKVEVEPLV